MMAKDPAQRFQTPDEVAGALAPFADAQAARAAATSPEAPASADAPTMPAASARAGLRRQPEAGCAESPTLGTTLPPLAPTVEDETHHRTPEASPQPRRPWLRIAAALALLPITAGFLAVVTYRIQTETGELVIESDDPSIDVIIKQGGKQITIVDPKSKNRIELKAGSYELQLAGGGEGLRLSTDSFALKRGDKTVVTVRREPRAPAPPLKPASDLLAGADTEEVGEIARFPGPHDWIGRAFFLPDGRRILYTTAGDFQNDQWLPGTEAALWLRDLADPKNPRKFAGFSTASWIDLALSRDGRLALTTSADKTLRLWDVETGKSRRVRREETGFGPVAFSPDERHAAYVCGDTIRLCDLKTGDELRTFRGHTGSIRTFSFCGDGRRLVSGGVDDHTIRVWNVETGEEIRQMRHGDGVTSATVFPDNRRVLTSSWDRTIGIWDLQTGQQLRRISGVANRYGASLAISPDSRRALFGATTRCCYGTWRRTRRSSDSKVIQMVCCMSRFRPTAAAPLDRTGQDGPGLGAAARPPARRGAPRRRGRPFPRARRGSPNRGGLPGWTSHPFRFRGQDHDPLGSSIREDHPSFRGPCGDCEVRRLLTRWPSRSLRRRGRQGGAALGSRVGPTNSRVSWPSRVDLQPDRIPRRQIGLLRRREPCGLIRARLGRRDRSGCAPARRTHGNGLESGRLAGRPARALRRE